MPEDVLAAELRALGRSLDVAAPPDPARMAEAVLARLAEAPEATRPVPTYRWLRYAAAVVVLSLAVLVAGSAQVRAAIAEFFRFAGVIVEQGAPATAPTAPTVPQPPPVERTVADVAAARAAVDFAVEVPAALGRPDQVTVIEDRVVSFAYNDGPIRVDQFDGAFDVAFAKSLLPQDGVEWVQVDGGVGLWLPEPHDIAYVDADGRHHTESSRLAAPTLVWERGRVTVRLEGQFSRAEALAIARSMG